MSKQRYNEIFNAFINYIKNNRLNIASMQNVNMHWNDFINFHFDISQKEQVSFVKIFGNDIKKLQRQFK